MGIPFWKFRADFYRIGFRNHIATHRGVPLAVTPSRITEKGQVAATFPDDNRLPVFAVAARCPAMPEKVCGVHLYHFPAITLALPDNALIFPLLKRVEGGQHAELLTSDVFNHDEGVNSLV